MPFPPIECFRTPRVDCRHSDGLLTLGYQQVAANARSGALAKAISSAEPRTPWRARDPPGRSGAGSDVVQLDSAMGCRGEQFDVRSLRGDDSASESKRYLGDSGVDGTNRLGQRPPQRAGLLGLFERERLHLTTVEEAGEIRLSATSPDLDHATRWYHREHTTLHGAGMKRPDPRVPNGYALRCTRSTAFENWRPYTGPQPSNAESRPPVRLSPPPTPEQLVLHGFDARRTMLGCSTRT